MAEIDLSYAVKVVELLETHTLVSFVTYNNEYRNLQHQYGFRWGNDSQHRHTRFLVKPQAAQAHYVWVRASEVIWSEDTRIITVLSDAK